MLTQTQHQNLQFYWLRNLRFDSAFLILPLITGVFFAAICVLQPNAFYTILLFDLWLLGYHHVISTYTRIAFDWTSAKNNRFLVFVLPIIVLVITFSLYKFLGSWIIATIYFYWQWFHYTRQSYGVSRYYLGRADKQSSLYKPIHTITLYALPVTGILYRSWQNNNTFLSMDLWNFPISYEMVVASIVISILLIINQLYSWWKLYLNGKLHGSYVLYILSHHFIFLFSYIIINDINIGWLAINMWHNMQYILFVWLQNNNKYKNGFNPDHPLISRISQNGKMWLYMLACLGITLFFYQVLIVASIIITSSFAISVSLIMFMAVNFHHYVVDAVIWKRKSSKISI